MTTIKTFFSKRRSVHNQIYVIPVNNKSRSAYLLLYEKLHTLDIDCWAHELKKWLPFREIFLSTQIIDGKLTCVYCGRNDLIIGYTDFDDRDLNNKIQNLATVDHIHPLSKGGEKYNETNCCVSCKNCNGKKGDKLLESYV